MIHCFALALACLPQEFSSSEFRIDAPSANAALRDVNRDGRLDFISLETQAIRVFLQSEAGSFPSEASSRFEWPERPLGWDLVDWEGDGSFELLCLDGESTINLWRADSLGQFTGPETVLENAGSFIPEGLRRMRFARDLNGDGQLDLVLPRGSTYRIYVRKSDGSFQEPHEIQFEAEIRTELGVPEELGSRISQSTKIPWFRIEDIDGDGFTDLIAETEDRATFYIADPELPSEPTWTLDVAALRDSVPEREGLDFDDLFANLTPSVRWRIAEISGGPPAELLLQTADTLKLYSGGSRFGIAKPPAQILRASGSILYFFLRDTNGDSLPELQIVRAEELSLGRLVRWLVLPGELKLDLFTYENQRAAAGGEAFGRKPSKRNTLAIQLPRLLSLDESVEDVEEQFEARAEIPARTFVLDSDGVANDIVDSQGGILRFYRDRCRDNFGDTIPGLAEGNFDRVLEHFVLEDMDALKPEATHEFGLDEIRALQFTRGPELRELCKGAEPAFELPLSISVSDLLLATCDLNGDGQQDLIAWGRDEDDLLQLQFVLRKPE